MRLLLVYLAVFLLPFALYACAIVLRRENPFVGRSWRLKDAAWLSLAGAVLVGFFIIVGSNAGQQISGRKTETTTTPQ